MAEKLIRIATPSEVHRFADAKTEAVEEALRQEGFDLGDLRLNHYFLHMKDPAFAGAPSLGYSTCYRSGGVTVGGNHYKDYFEALNDLVGLFEIHKEDPAFLLTSPDLYDGGIEGDLLHRTLVDDLGYGVERVLTLEQRREQEQDEPELVEKAG